MTHLTQLTPPTPPSQPRSQQRLTLVALAMTAGWLTACGGGGDAGSAALLAAGGTVGSAPVSATTTSPTPAASSPVASAVLAPDSTCNLPNFQADLLRQINAARAAGRSCGATAFSPTSSLAWNARLFAAAEGHSRDMASNNYFSHTSLDGRSASSRVTTAGYVWRATGENIAAGQRDVTTVMNGWLASEGHCRNIMNPSYQDVAVACVQQSGTTYGRYWTMVLARP
ncbi:CAP domain-containing protein [Hydrogenophaga sp.]|uniref:CAP domain-containing protein n=1 Tax=Hydrogenophaga sp. TaxID=1904254 RepID=UPI0025BD33FC|nr:CAP domain-containing protein [Hydrogenophaga sp.]